MSWYDGFIFGNTHDIYNPWSITNFLDKKQVRPYWADTSSNSMIDELIRKASTDIKEKMEELLQGKEIVVNFDEQILQLCLKDGSQRINPIIISS